jgi:hypothetical protein
MIEMALEKLANIFTGTRGKLAAAALSAVAMVSTFSGAAQADDARAQPVSLSTTQQCMPLLKSSQGTDINASSSAHGYSKFNPGSVGVSIYPGKGLEFAGFKDAHQLGLEVVGVLRDAGIDAQCFINNSFFEDSGPSIAFHVHGLRIKLDGKDSFGIDQVWDDPRVLRAAYAEAKMVERHKDGLALAH